VVVAGLTSGFWSVQLLLLLLHGVWLPRSPWQSQQTQKLMTPPRQVPQKFLTRTHRRRYPRRRYRHRLCISSSVMAARSMTVHSMTTVVHL
jgi:hypothetical protein